MQTLKITHHAMRRCQQRAMRQFQLSAICQMADLSTAVDRQLTAIRISKVALAEAVAEGMPSAIANLLSRRAIVMSDDGTIITVAHVCGSKSKAYRRRDRRPYWKGGK